jgi:oxygen-dependent protoporphyrinogen oxidase
MVVLTSFIGGATDPQVISLAEDEIAAIVEKENAQALRITGSPAGRAVHRYSRALPQYNLGHTAIMAALRVELARFPGLFLTGNYLEGPAIGACVEQAFRTAASARAYLESNYKPSGRGPGGA